MYLHEEAGERRLAAVGLDGAGVESGVGGAVYPGAPDGLGAAAAVRVDEAEGHVETLGLLDGTGFRPLLKGGRVRNPTWSPGGGFVVVEADRESASDLYRVDRDGTVTRLTSAAHGAFEPAISPDGAAMVYGASRDGNAEIVRKDLRTGEELRLTTDPADDVHPAWPGRISWIAHRGGRGRLWTMAADGSAAAPLSDEEVVDYAWNHDGTRVAVVVRRERDTDVEVWEADGTLAASLGSPAVDEGPSWSPDGTGIVFTSERDGDAEIYAWWGGRLRRLTTRPGTDWLPRWVR